MYGKRGTRGATVSPGKTMDLSRSCRLLLLLQALLVASAQVSLFSASRQSRRSAPEIAARARPSERGKGTESRAPSPTRRSCRFLRTRVTKRRDALTTNVFSAQLNNRRRANNRDATQCLVALSGMAAAASLSAIEINEATGGARHCTFARW